MTIPEPPESKGTPRLHEELLAIATGLETLAHSIETNMSEERLSSIVAQEQQVNQQKFARLNAILVVTLVVLVVGLAGVWKQSNANHDQGAKTQRIARDAAVTADFVRDCLQPNQLTQAEKTQRCASASTPSPFFITYLNCALQLQPATESALNVCVQKGIAAATGK